LPRVRARRGGGISKEFAMLTASRGALRIAISVLMVAAAAWAPRAFADDMTGAGATFPQPIYTRWGELYGAGTGDKLNYQGVGSGAGVTQIINRTVDFGASDAAVASDRLTKNNLLQFPAVIGAVVVAVNIPGVDGNQVKLTGALIGDMYLGKIRMWNDPRIKALNPGIDLPVAAVAPAYRADSSGTTNIFTTFLSASSLTFSTAIGAGNAVPWKAGIGAQGNAGVAGAIQNTRGGIGYVEYAYAVENKMQTPSLQNRSGAWVKPTEEGFAASAAVADWAHASNLAASMINTLGAPNWPIVSATYILLPKNPTDAAASLRVMKFFDWAFNSGAPAAEQLHYIVLPASVQAQVRAAWKQVTAQNRPVWAGN
jgi:phosphate transport system substrate-binding protein